MLNKLLKLLFLVSFSSLTYCNLSNKQDIKLKTSQNDSIVSSKVDTIFEGGLNYYPSWRNNNDIRDITEDSLFINFVSEAGIVKLNKKTNQWKFKIFDDKEKYKFPPQYQYKTFIIPKWIGFDFLKHIETQTFTKDSNIFIFELYNECSECSQQFIVDLITQRLIKIPCLYRNKLLKTKTNYWIGKNYGISLISEKNNKFTDINIFPDLLNISGWIKYNNIILICNNGYFISLYDTILCNVKSVDLPKLILDNFFENIISEFIKDPIKTYNDEILSDKRIIFSNPVLHNKIVYISAFLVNPHNYAISNNLLLKFNITNNSISALNLGDFSRVTKLEVIKDNIFGFGNRIEMYEGGATCVWGGFFIIDSKDSLHRFDKSIKSDRFCQNTSFPMISYYLTNEKIIIYGYIGDNFMQDFIEGLFLYINLKTLELITDIKNTSKPDSEMLAGFQEIKYGLTEVQKKEFLSFKIRPQVMSVDKGFVKIIDKNK